MAPPTVQTLQRLAAETGYRLDTLEKVLRLLELLDEIAQDPVLSQRLALKGGTALNVFYLDLDRLSVDIDLNYVGALDLAAMERERAEVDAAIDRLFASHGDGVRRRPTGHAGGKWLARYASALGGNASLELDLNYMARQPLFGAARMESRILGRVGTGRVLVLDLHENRGRKDRGAVRPGCCARSVRCTAHPRDRGARPGLDQGRRPGARRVQPAGLAGRIEGRHRMRFTRVSPQSRHLPAPRPVPRRGRCRHVDRTVRGAVQGRARVPLRVVGERAELSRRGPRPWRGERESAWGRARGRGAHRAPCRCLPGSASTFAGVGVSSRESRLVSVAVATRRLANGTMASYLRSVIRLARHERGSRDKISIGFWPIGGDTAGWIGDRSS